MTHPDNNRLLGATYRLTMVITFYVILAGVRLIQVCIAVDAFGDRVWRWFKGERCQEK